MQFLIAMALVALLGFAFTSTTFAANEPQLYTNADLVKYEKKAEKKADKKPAKKAKKAKKEKKDKKVKK